LFSIGYTYARGPSDYCNDIKSPPEKIISINGDGMLEEAVNPKLHLTNNRPSHGVRQETHFPMDLNYPLASSPGANGSIIRDFDLNKIPPDEDK